MIDFKQFDEAQAAIPEAFFKAKPACGLILGSGWSNALTPDEPPLCVPYQAIPHLGASTVQGHAGTLQLMKLGGKTIVVFAGRRHYYEGCGWMPVVMPVELMRRMGIKTILLTNAAGGVSSRLQPGDLMVIRDHINVSGLNPLQGPHHPEWGTRFPDMSNLYNRQLSRKLLNAGTEDGHINEGVYLFNPGPAYETPAEVRTIGTLGADAVGMSTVPEALLANAIGMKVVALSCITNMAAGISGPHLNHKEVLEQSKLAQPRMAAVITKFVLSL